MNTHHEAMDDMAEFGSRLNTNEGVRRRQASDLPSIQRLREKLVLDVDTGVLRRASDGTGGTKAGDVAGSVNSVGYLRLKVDGCELLAHRVIFAMTNGRWPDADLDHINGNRRDNRPANLREATFAENNRNTGIGKNNTSGAKGVSTFQRGRKWRATCQVNGVSNYLGRFDTAEEAAAAVRAFRERNHGEFARHE